MDARVVVTAAEFTRQFGQLRQEPGDAPVFITHHGRETHVLLTRRRYDALVTTDRVDSHNRHAALSDLAEWLPHAVLIVDNDTVVRFANPAAHVLLQQPTGQLAGRRLAEAVPAIADSLIESYLRRVVRGGEAASADLPSPVRAHAWLQVEMRPAADTVTILLRDITDDVLRHRLADRSRAVADAARLSAGVGQVVLNVRGFIEAADAAVCDWLALPAARLVGVPLADLVPSAGRVGFREKLDTVLRGAGPTALDLTLVTNTGDALALGGALVELRGLYGSEGAILLLTRR